MNKREKHDLFKLSFLTQKFYIFFKFQILDIRPNPYFYSYCTEGGSLPFTWSRRIATLICLVWSWTLLLEIAIFNRHGYRSLLAEKESSATLPIFLTFCNICRPVMNKSKSLVESLKSFFFYYFSLIFLLTKIIKGKFTRGAWSRVHGLK